jgi:hypothetical protein
MRIASSSETLLQMDSAPTGDQMAGPSAMSMYQADLIATKCILCARPGRCAHGHFLLRLRLAALAAASSLTCTPLCPRL